MEEKIVICPDCGAAVPNHWKYCPKCAHLMAEEPVITVLPPPASQSPDWQQRLQEAVEVSYLDESDLESPGNQADDSLPGSAEALFSETDPSEEKTVPPPKENKAANGLRKIFHLSHSPSGEPAPPSAEGQVSHRVQSGSHRAKHRTKVVPPPVYLALERKRNHRLAALTLIAVLILGCGAPFFFWAADTKALKTSLQMGWSRSEVNERTPYAIALRFEDGLVETYQKSPFYRTDYVLSQKPYTVTSPNTVKIDGKEYHITFSDDRTILTMRPAFSFYGEKEVWYRQDSEAESHAVS